MARRKKRTYTKKKKFNYGEIIPKGKIIHEYSPSEVLEKFYFKKFNVIIEAESLKEAKEKVSNMFCKEAVRNG